MDKKKPVRPKTDEVFHNVTGIRYQDEVKTHENSHMVTPMGIYLGDGVYIKADGTLLDDDPER